MKSLDHDGMSSHEEYVDAFIQNTVAFQFLIVVLKQNSEPYVNKWIIGLH